MLERLESLRSTFWSEYFWTPPNASWALYEEQGYRHFNDIYYSAYSAIGIILLRVLLDRTIFKPLGQWFGLSPVRKIAPPQSNPLLERVYLKSQGKLSEKQVTSLRKQLDISDSKVQRWMRRRAAQDRPTVLDKFAESAWRGTFYLILFTYGLYVLWDKPWMWDSVQGFVNYPHHRVSDSEWWYYNIEIAFYLSLMVTQFLDVKRKDFWMMFFHHMVTLSLLTFSWACNLFRMGSLAMLIHDLADIPLEGAKMMIYAKRKRAADIAFNLFALCWVVSRLIMLPYRIIYYGLVVVPHLITLCPAYYVFNGLMAMLQIVHLLWTYFIVKMAVQNWTHDNVKDLRSDDEDEDISEDTD